MAVAGDSAGGYMALYVAQKLKEEGIALKAQVVAYPVTDHYTSGLLDRKQGGLYPIRRDDELVLGPFHHRPCPVCRGIPLTVVRLLRP